MDVPHASPQIIQCQCPHRRRWWSPIGSLFRFLGLVILLVVVFFAGLMAGGSGTRGMLAGRLLDAPFGTGAPRDGWGMNRGSRVFGLGCSSDDTRFGVITAVSGQMLTVADNGGGTHLVLVTSGTTVMDGDTEIPMWKLRTGYSVRSYGDAEDGVITADLIEVVR